MDLGNFELDKTKYEYSPADPQNSNLKGLMTTDYGKLQTDLTTPGDYQINKAFNTADNKNRDIMGGGGMYGSSIYSDNILDSADRRGNALASNAAQAGATVAQLKSNENQWLGNASLDEARMKNTWGLGQDTLNKTLAKDMILAELSNKYSLGQIDAQGEWGLKNINSQGDWNLKNINTQGDWGLKNIDHQGEWGLKNINAQGDWGMQNINRQGELNLDNINRQSLWNLINTDRQGEWGLKNIDAQGGWGMNTARYNAGAANDAAKSNAWGSLGGAALGGLMSNFGDITSTVGSWF